jgi:hypothetical protein
MNRWIWAVRIFGILMVLVMLMILMHLQRQLAEIRENRPVQQSH